MSWSVLDWLFFIVCGPPAWILMYRLGRAFQHAQWNWRVPYDERVRLMNKGKSSW